MISSILTFRILLAKGVTLVVVTLAILQLVGKLLDNQIPYYWANSKFDNHSHILYESENSTNTIFVGSSFTLAGFNPILFDSLMDNRTRSFNFGWELLVIPETYYWLDNFIESKASNTEPQLTVFFELNKVHPIKKYENSNRFYYMLNPSSFKILWEAIDMKKVSYLEKLRLRNNLIQGFVINYFNIGLVGDKIQYYFSGATQNENDSFEKTNGYRPAYKSIGEKDIIPFNRYKRKVRKNRKANNLDCSYLVNYTNSLLNKAAKKNIEVIFVIMPGQVDSSTNCLKNTLREDQLIDFGDPSTALYDMENRKNMGHLNNRGAELLTSLLADECIKRNYFE